MVVAWTPFFFFSSRRRHTRFDCDWSSDVCSSDLSPSIPRLARWPSNRGRVRAVTMRPWAPSTYATRSPTIPSGRTSARPSGSPAMDLTGKRHSSATCIVSSGYLQLLRVPPLRVECRIERRVGDRVDVVGERLRGDVSHDLQDLRFCVAAREERLD